MKAAYLLLAAALAPAACAKGAHPASEPPALPVAKVRLLKPHAAVEEARAPATIEPVQRATVSTRVPARVQEVHVREGDAVKEGALLVSLADADLRAQLAAAQASLASALAQEGRIERLATQNAATQSELESARAGRAQAQAQVGAAREALRYAELRAPFEGRVQAKHVSAGDLVTPGTPLVEVEGRALQLVASLSGEEVARLARGQRLTFEADGGRGLAEVTSIAPSADPLAHRVEVRARLVEAPPELRAGSFARLALPAERATPALLWIPLRAVVQRGDLRGVFVAHEGRAQLRWLLLGDAAGDAVPVRAGLREGEQVVDAPGDLKDGQRLEVVHAP